MSNKIVCLRNERRLNDMCDDLIYYILKFCGGRSIKELMKTNKWFLGVVCKTQTHRFEFCNKMNVFARGVVLNSVVINSNILKEAKELTFIKHFNSPLNNLISYTNITHLTFGECFNYCVCPLKYLVNLKYLELGNTFNTNEGLNSLANLETLILGDSFNCDIDTFKLYNLRVLEIGHSFNKPIHNLLSKCIYLETLTLGNSFNYPLVENNNLSILILGNLFNYPIPNLPNLKLLSVGNHFNQPFTNSYPLLTNISFGDEFNCSLEFLAHSPKLQSLKLGRNFNHHLGLSPLNNLPRLHNLYVSHSFDFSLLSILNKYPQILKVYFT